MFSKITAFFVFALFLIFCPITCFNDRSHRLFDYHVIFINFVVIGKNLQDFVVIHLKNSSELFEFCLLFYLLALLSNLIKGLSGQISLAFF